MTYSTNWDLIGQLFCQSFSDATLPFKNVELLRFCQDFKNKSLILSKAAFDQK